MHQYDTPRYIQEPMYAWVRNGTSISLGHPQMLWRFSCFKHSAAHPHHARWSKDGQPLCTIWVCLKRGAPKFWWFKHHFSYQNSHLGVYAHFQSFLFQRSQHSLFSWGLQMKINAQRKRYVHLGLSEITAAGHLKNRCGPSFSYEYNQFGRYSNKINS
jgi:hypothetical protein